MEWGSAAKNFKPGAETCAICGKKLYIYDMMDCDWNMQRPGKYIYWHKECYQQAKRGNKNG